MNRNALGLVFTLAVTLALAASCTAGEAAPEKLNWRTEMENRLKVQVTLNFNGSRIEFVSTLQSLAEVPIVVDPAHQFGEGHMGLSTGNMRLLDALQWMRQMLNCSAEIQPGAIYVSGGGDDAWPKKADAVEPATDDDKKADEVIKRLLTGAPAELSAEARAAVEKLIADFGSDNFQKRDAASTAAAELGREALPLLRKAAESKDPEVAERARAAISAVEGNGKLKAELGKLTGAKKFIAARTAQSAWEWGEKARAVIAAENDPKADTKKLLEEATAAGKRAAALGDAVRAMNKGK